MLVLVMLVLMVVLVSVLWVYFFVGKGDVGFDGGGIIFRGWGDAGFDVLFGDFCVLALFGVRDFRGVPLLGGVVHGAFVDSDRIGSVSDGGKVVIDGGMTFSF